VVLSTAMVLIAFRAAAQPETRPLRRALVADIAAGKRIFEGQCAWCHGAAGTGGSGPNLQRAALRRAADDQSLVKIVRSGIPGTEMPSFSTARRERTAWQTAAYVRSLGRTVSRPPPGDAARGAGVYQKSGCASCHAVDGQGGGLGPDLSAIGATRGPEHLRQSLVE